MDKGHTFILLFQCRDRKGIVAKISEFILRSGGNIISAGQHTTCPLNGDFFMRVEFFIEGSSHDKDSLNKELTPVAREFDARYGIYDKSRMLRMGIFASRPGHCLFELLYLWKSGALKVNIPFVASNFSGHKELVEQFKIPFYFIPAAKQERREEELLALAVKDSDFLVLARYMLVLSPEFLKSYAKDIINIHHGLLPSFKGPDPYRQALEKGVKVIGATSHFVTEALDDGPIIAQAVVGVSHRDDLWMLAQKGKNLEKRALSEAVDKYIDRRIIRYNNKTIVF